MVKDKGEGEGTKPSSEATSVFEIQDDLVRTREIETKDIPPPTLDKKRKSLFLQPKSEAGVGRIRFLMQQNLDFHLALYVTCVRVWISHRWYHLYLLNCC